jgi:aspartate/methionine/tyrosine aminotransferase
MRPEYNAQHRAAGNPNLGRTEAAAMPFFLLCKLLARLGVAGRLPWVRRRLGRAADSLRYFSDRVLDAPWDELRQWAGQLAPPAPDVIDLSQGSPRFDLTPSTTTKLPADRRGWPPVGGLPPLKAAIAEKLLADHCLRADPNDEVLIADGAFGAASAALDAFVNRGDRVVLLDPSSPMYPLILRDRGARIVWLPAWTEEGRTRIRPDHLARALEGAKLLVICSPNNPTGGVLAAEDLEQIVWWAIRRDVLVLSDESFERFRYDAELASVGALPGARRRTLTVGGVSKGYGLAAARVGWLTAERGLLAPCRAAAALRAPFVPMLSQQAALAALRTGPETFAAIHKEYAARKRYSLDRLRAVDLAVTEPAGAFFLWTPVWTLGVSGQEFTDGLLREKKVLVTPGEWFGPSGPGWVRISFAADDGRLHEGMQRLCEYVSELRGQTPVAARAAA